MILVTAWHLMALCILDIGDTEMVCFLHVDRCRALLFVIIYIYISKCTAVYHPHSYMEITKLTTHICFIIIYLWILSKCRYLDPWHISLKIRYVSICRTQIYYFILYLPNINVITDSTRLVEGDRLWLWRYCITGGVEEGGPDHHSTASLAGPRHRKSSTPEDTVKPTKIHNDLVLLYT